LSDDTIQPILCLLVSGKALFIGAEGVGVVAAAAVYQARRVFDVQHLMKENEFDKPLRHVGCIQGLANRNGFMDRIVMTENSPGAPLRPCQLGLFDAAIKVTAIKAREKFFEIIVLPPR
jgi:hypothetical protein